MIFCSELRKRGAAAVLVLLVGGCGGGVGKPGTNGALERQKLSDMEAAPLARVMTGEGIRTLPVIASDQNDASLTSVQSVPSATGVTRLRAVLISAAAAGVHFVTMDCTPGLITASGVVSVSSHWQGVASWPGLVKVFLLESSSTAGASARLQLVLTVGRGEQTTAPRPGPAAVTNCPPTMRLPSA